ncbi:MAG TPA: hypothetical protein VF062_16315 [Candidatus Limnocylindrales bacterium]
MISNLLIAAALAAHPLGSVSVNQLVELTVRPDRIDAVAVLDLAELPTLQIKPACEEFAAALTVRVDGAPVKWTVQSRQSELADGAAGLKTFRLTCELTAPADLRGQARVAVDNRFLPDRVGWHEIAATGDGVSLQTGLPSRSTTDRLRNYPSDPLSSPADVRSAEFTTKPGTDTTREAAAVTEDRSFIKRAETWLTGAVGDLTPIVGLLAVLLALMLGAAHAALPGHGKTVIAVYMAGRQGRKRDAFIVGATVTLTHTAGVLILGLGLTTVASLAAESVLSWLGVISGTIVFAVGVGLLAGALRGRKSLGHHHHHHDHDHSHGDHDHDHGHHHHHHDHGTVQTRGSLAALGVAGGLVPSPTALVVLLGAVALGKTWFGVLLIVFYGLGMAGTLTAAGLLLLKLRDRWAWLAKLSIPPAATSSLIIALGLGLAARAAFNF